MARAGVVAETPAASGPTTAPSNCRMVMQRSETGFGGSLSRVCGDGAAAEAALNRLTSSMRSADAAQPCDRPGSEESQAAWIARCEPVRPR